ncbi:single-stranded DNA-binding protein [Spirosoma radiotolerans]|uniref:Single-stranded DNA-binding protein n=1 Tax=Spirosoma radiotolerans TaxID=1379870 RepID=A0A0E3ZWU8_9BACT|nr:single-stranded DNA-binding protein [Spirosoma radiotolerans]AKD55963.1 single-stranded DNA-binding protein [Spirosoma radiotolerans]
MRGLNKVTLIGSISKDIEIQHLEGSISVARFLLTTTETVNDKNGQIQTNTEQHTIVLRRELAELAHKYLQRGSLIFLEGKLKTHPVDDTEGQTCYVTEIMGEHLVVLDKGNAIYMDELGKFT